MREQIEPEGFFDDTQDETRPALEAEARKALDMANARRKSLAPLIDKDAETAAMLPGEVQGYQAALERLKQQRLGQSQPPPKSVPPPPADKTSRDREKSDPAFALAQLTAQRQSGGTAPPPPMPRTGASAMPPMLQRPPTGPMRPLSLESAGAIPSARDLAANVRRSMVDAKPSSSPSVTPPPSTDDPDVIKSLLGGPVPPAPRLPQDPLALSGGTAPMKLADLGLKPATSNIPLAPQRTPAPLAVVGKGGGVMVTDRPGSMPPAGFGFPKTQPSAQAPARPQLSSRPPGAFGPPPGQSAPPKQYDFKRWSSPDISEMPNDGAPVTFQVYTAQDVVQGRGPMRSMPMIESQPKSAGSIAVKIGLAVLGGIIVLITAAAVIMVSTDDPKKPVDPTPPPPTTSAAPSVTLAPEAPTVLVIPGDAPEEPVVPTSTTKKPLKPSGGGGGGGPAPKPPPPSNVTPPPNPYGKP